jgi:hypothetical protein
MTGHKKSLSPVGAYTNTRRGISLSRARSADKGLEQGFLAPERDNNAPHNLALYKHTLIYINLNGAAFFCSRRRNPLLALETSARSRINYHAEIKARWRLSANNCDRVKQLLPSGQQEYIYINCAMAKRQSLERHHI